MHLGSTGLGNIVLLSFLRENTRLASENPFIPLTFDGFGTVQSDQAPQLTLF